MANNIENVILKELDWLFVPTGMIRQDVLQKGRENYSILLAVGATLLEIARDGFYYGLYKYLS